VGLATRYYFLSECCCLKLAILFLWGALSDEKTGPQFAVYSVNGPSRLEPVTILYSHMRLPQPRGPGSRIYILQEQGDPVIPRGTGFPLRPLLPKALQLRNGRACNVCETLTQPVTMATSVYGRHHSISHESVLCNMFTRMWVKAATLASLLLHTRTIQLQLSLCVSN
jgi:hypothetical protein